MEKFMECKRCFAIYGCYLDYGKNIPRSTKTCKNCQGCRLAKASGVIAMGFCDNCLWDLIASYNGG